MCKLLLGIQLQAGSQEYSDMLKTQMQSVLEMEDGLGGVAIRQDNSFEVAREVKEEKYGRVVSKIVKEIPQAKIISVHGRQATTGAVNDKNVHFFRNGDYLFAHNGIVSAYSSYGAGEVDDTLVEDTTEATREDVILDQDGIITLPLKKEKEDEDKELLQTVHDYLNECKGCFPMTARYCNAHGEQAKEYEDQKKLYPDWKPVYRMYGTFQAEKKGVCDSLKFLQSLSSSDVQAKKLGDTMNKKQFYGVGLLLDTRQNKGFLIGTREISVQTDFQNYLFFYSYVPETTVKQYKEMCGFRFGIDGEEEIPVYTLGAGIYEFSFADKFQLDKFLK